MMYLLSHFRERNFMRIKHLLLLLAVLPLLAILLLYSSSGSIVEITPSDEEWIMVGAYVDDSWFQEIYGVNTKDPQQLVLDAAPIGNEPDWSPDGQWVAYDNFGFVKGLSAIYLEKNDRARKIKVADGYAPVWSPNGNQIAYKFRDEIYLLNVECFIESRFCDLNPSFVTTGNNPSWSPDGDKIVFEREYDIYTINMVTFESVEVFAPLDGGCRKPDWSITNKILMACWGEYQGLYVINSDGTDITKFDNGDLGWESPKWSPSGEKIAFVDYLTISSVEGSTSVVYVMDSNGDNLIRLTEHDNYSIAWFTWIPPFTKPEICTVFCK